MCVVTCVESFIIMYVYMYVCVYLFAIMTRAPESGLAPASSFASRIHGSLPSTMKLITRWPTRFVDKNSSPCSCFVPSLTVGF